MTDAPIPAGTLFAGKYAITQTVGRGAMSTVYEAKHVEVGKRVAIKVIDPEYAGHEEVCARFRQEAQAAGRIESEHIVQVFDVGNDPSFGLFMVMEFLSGEDLGARLDREFKLSPALAVHIAVQAARGLAKAHTAGVIHRDLKPANLFLVPREDGTVQVKIVDFGISKLLDRPGRHQGRALTRMGTTVGTPQYMSPEQVRGHPVDERTDVWALGAVLFEMLAGAPVYAHELTYEQTVLAIVNEPPPLLWEVAPWVPPELADVVMRAMTPSLDARIRDCNEFASRLAGALPNAVRPRREASLYLDVAPDPVPATSGSRRPAAGTPSSVPSEPRVVVRPPSPVPGERVERTRGPATEPSLRVRHEQSRGRVRQALFLVVFLGGLSVATYYVIRTWILDEGTTEPTVAPAESAPEGDLAGAKDAGSAKTRGSASASKSARPRSSGTAPVSAPPPTTRSTSKPH